MYITKIYYLLIILGILINKRKILHGSFNLKLSSNYINKILNKIYTITLYNKLKKLNKLGVILKEPILYLIFNVFNIW